MKSDGASILLAHNFLTRSGGLLAGNVRVLREHLAGAGAVLIPDIDGFVDEAERHTFNLLMSSIALRDLGYRVLKVPLIADSDLPRANKERVKVFSDDVQIALIGELRDHMAHRGLPPLNVVTAWSTEHGMTHTAVLVRGPLVRDKKVNSDVREYLQKLEDDPAFEPLIGGYIRAQWDWLLWFQKELRHRFSAKLTELDAALSPWNHGINPGG